MGVLLLIGFVPASGALAATPVTLDGVVYDETGSIIESQRSSLEASIGDLRERTGVTLYVVVVDTFETPSDGFDWATQVAKRNALSSKDVIMYVGLADLETGLNVSKEVPIGDDEIDDIVADDILPSTTVTSPEQPNRPSTI